MVCAGCGHAEPDDAALTFRCPNAEAAADAGGDIDHVLVSQLDSSELRWPSGDEANPFVRYRILFHTYRLARRRGMSDAEYVAIVDALDANIRDIAGTGFVVTPDSYCDDLGARIKDETNNVSGSHKARHLFGLAVHLRIVAELGLWDPIGVRLAIASCGNAALAAAVVAKAAAMPLDVFIPKSASETTVAELNELGARLIVCERGADDPLGDPCYRRFRDAVAGGALPFTCQGNENGLVIDGGRTLGYELVAWFRQSTAPEPTCVVIQVGGGALFSAVASALRLAGKLGVLDRLPTMYAVQTQNVHPLRIAWQQLTRDGELSSARRNRSRYMKPWPSPPHSVAGGIVDDETYDWAAVCEALLETGGDVVLVAEEALRAARDDAKAVTGIDVSATGAAGLAGLQSLRKSGKLATGDPVTVLFTGKQR